MSESSASQRPEAEAERPDDAVDDTQWTTRALTAYRSQLEALAGVLQEHAALTASRSGHHREVEAYFASARRLQATLNAFAEAEFDWCGSFPIRADLTEEDDLEDDSEEWPQPDPSLSGSSVVSVLGRWDYVITDLQALIQHGRASYLKYWPEEEMEDAEVRVTSVEGAVREILHSAPLPSLDESPGLQPTNSVVELVQHAGTSEEEMLEDPFGSVFRG